MKDFFKFTFASCLGVLLATIVVTIFGSLIIGAVINSSNANSESSQDLKSNSILSLHLNQQMPELTNNTAQRSFNFENPEILGLHDMLDLIEHAKDDEDIKGLYIDGDQIITGFSSSRLLRDAILDFKSSGKPVVAHANNYGQMPYYVASTADHVFMSPTGFMDFRGFGAVNPFFKNTMEKLDLSFNVYYAGDFKSATEPFRRTSMSPENKEQTRAYLNESYDLFLSDIAENKNITVGQLRAAANTLKTWNPAYAQQEGLIDELGYRSDAFDKIKELLELEDDDKIHLVRPDKYVNTYNEERKGDSKQRVAVVFAEGEIGDGANEPGKITGDKYVTILRKLRKQEKVKAVVLRVNSPGGSVISSDDIWHEVERLQEEGKPVVVSMGDMAASGGYYISCGSDKIFAQPNTITGSIGVFSMFPNTGDFMRNKLGITFDTVGTAKYANRLNSLYEPNAEESVALQAAVDNYYRVFLERVSEGRNMSVEEVHKVAQGRIWTGQKAVELGLVDELGTLEDAIVSAASLAELEDYRIYEYPKIKNQWEQLLDQFTNKEDVARVAIDNKLSETIPYYDYYRSCIESEGPQARLPLILTF